MHNLSPLRQSLNQPLDGIVHLQYGLLDCAPITDPGQQDELRRVKRDILAALDREAEIPSRPVRPAQTRIGDRMPDGTVYAGVSPHTGRPMYTTPADAPLTYTFKEAMAYATELDTHGHRGWRVPAKSELNVLFNNRAAIGGFNESGSDPAGWHRSSSEINDFSAWSQRLSDGYQFISGKDYGSYLRCVRG